MIKVNITKDEDIPLMGLLQVYIPLPTSISNRGNQSSIRTSTLDSLQSSLAIQSVGPSLQPAQPAVKQNQHTWVQAPNL
jgi:hypothetical protein